MNLSLLTDFYELTMMHGYFLECPNDYAVFEMFFRRQPFEGGFAIFAGLKPFLEALGRMRFGKEEISYLESKKIFKKEFLKYLSNFRFKGDIFSVQEGSVVFPNEPLIRVHGNLIEVQCIESMLLNFINFQSLIATKTARIVNMAEETPVLDFGLRRAQGIDGSLSATRSAYIGGTAATSNTLAGMIYDIPVSGTMAHSWVMSFESELESFQKYTENYPDNCVLLVDTYDTLESGLPNAITVFKQLRNNNPSLMAIRIDSGDLDFLSKAARDMLDKAGLSEVKIFVSSDLDEYIIRQLRESQSPIDAWGVGTRLVTGWGDPALTGVYKVVASNDDNVLVPRIKISNQAEKITNPGIKNVMRFYNSQGQIMADLIYLEEEADVLLDRVKRKEPIRFNHPATNYEGFTMEEYNYTESMLCQVMKGGRIIEQLPSLNAIRDFRKREMCSLEYRYRRLLNPHIYKVSLSNKLKDLKTMMIKKIRKDLDE